MKAYRSFFPTMALLAMGGAKTETRSERLEAQISALTWKRF
jgi:hypothetical protein